jgi:hypothetical protein
MSVKSILISSSAARRKEFFDQIEGPKVVVCKDRCEFSPSYSLEALYKDEVFFDAMANVTSDVSLVFDDLGPLIHCADSSYLSAYVKLKPLALQARNVYIVDRLAFYYSRKSIIRPFFYLHEQVFTETLQEFYGVGVYADNQANEWSVVVPAIKPHIEMDQGEIPVQVVEVRPTQDESEAYERLKYKLIMVDRKSKSSVINGLFKFIDQMESKKAAIASCSIPGAKVPSNDFRRVEKTYSEVIGHGGVFFDTGFGLDSMGLERTVSAIRDHNELVRRLNG